MAIFSLNMKGYSRGKGQSAVAGAAYRACTRLEERETGQIYDYTRKQGLRFEAIAAPQNVTLPTGMQEREELWNHVHSIEKAKNARLAREMVLALPHELDDEQRAELALDYAQWVADRHQVVCDVVIHAPDRRSDERNYHMHLMMTARQITDEGFSKRKSQTIDGKTERFIPLDYKDSRGADEIKAMRGQAADFMNEALERAGLDVRVDHRSFVEQELDRLPMIHLGKEATTLERMGVETELGDKNRNITRFNEIQEAVNYKLPPTLDAQKITELFPAAANDNQPPKTVALFGESSEMPPAPEKQGLFDNLRQHFNKAVTWVRGHATELMERWRHEEERAQEYTQEQELERGYNR